MHFQHRSNIFQIMRISSQQKYATSKRNLPSNNYNFNGYAPRNNYANNSSLSSHTDHLWNMLQDVEIYPNQVHHLLRFEEKNLSNYKKTIDREKIKANQQIQNMKKECIHNIDDFKISVLASLDKIYLDYMEKYAIIKRDIMEIKNLKEDIQMDMERRSKVYVPKYTTAKDRNEDRYNNYNNNANIMRAIESNTLEAKKSEMLKYIAQLQKHKLLPLNQLTKQLTILTQYENGYYQSDSFLNIAQTIVSDFRAALQNISERKYQFIRNPDLICHKEEKHILDEIYEPPVATRIDPVIVVNKPLPNPVTNYQQFRRAPPMVSKIEEVKFNSFSQSQQNISFDSAENIALSHIETIKSVSEEGILCAIEISKNIIAIGGNDGLINIYDITNGQNVAILRGHRAGICKLAIVMNNGKKYLASGSSHGCCSIAIWDIATWNMRMRIENHSAAVTSIVDLRDNRSLISGSFDRTINVYDLNNEGQILYNLPVNKTQVSALLLNCNGNKLISCGLDNSLSVWKVVRNNSLVVQTVFLERIIENNTLICSVIASILQPDLIYLGAKDGKIKLINIERGDAFKIYNVCNTSVVEIVAIERQNKSELPLLIFWASNDENIKVINTETGRVISMPAKGSITYGCETGPKAFFLSSGRHLGMLSQAAEIKQINLFKLDMIN